MKISIFCGGSGKRFWPLSRKGKPKQLLKIFDGRSTLQITFDRLIPIIPSKDIFVSTMFSYFSEIKKQLPQLSKKNLVGEPEYRDLGPAVALNAAIIAEVKGLDEPFAILWSDHILKREGRFREMLKMAEKLVSSGEKKIVFFGCLPRFANENLGWIGLSDRVEKNKRISKSGLLSFKYRPSKHQADKFFKSGKYVWNLGYFVSTPRYILEVFEEHERAVYQSAKKIAQSWGRSDYKKVLERIYPTMKKISFDDAVLEKLNFKEAAVLVADLGWADIGNPYAFKESVVGNNNLFVGPVLDRDSRDTLVYNDSDILVATVGLEGMVVVATKDVLLVCGKDDAKEIKKTVEELEEKGRTELI